MKYTVVDSIASINVEHNETDWSDLVEFFSTFTAVSADGRKDYSLFTGWQMKDHATAKFSTTSTGLKHYSRCGDNCETLQFLTLDVDNDPKNVDKHPYWSFDQAIQALKGIECVLYSSFNHLNPEKHGGIDKFRVVLPLKTPLSLQEYRDRKNSIRAMFPSAATESFTPSQPYWPPLSDPSRRQYERAYHSSGEFIDLLACEVHAAPEQRFQSSTSTATGTDGDASIVVTATTGKCQTAAEWFDELREGYDFRVPSRTPLLSSPSASPLA